MKRKILMSVFVLMLTCFITLGCVGCDTKNPAKLEVPSGTTITVTQENLDAAKLAMGHTSSMEPGQEVLLKAKELAWGEIKISFDVDGDGEETAVDYTYTTFIEAGGIVTGFSLNNASGTMTLKMEGAKCDVPYTVGWLTA